MTFMGALRRSHIALNHGPWRESSRPAPTTRKASPRPLLRYTNVLKPRARRSPAKVASGCGPPSLRRRFAMARPIEMRTRHSDAEAERAAFAAGRSATSSFPWPQTGPPAAPSKIFDRDRTLCYDHFSVVRLWKPMLRKTVIGVSFFAFVGLGIISLSDCSIPQLEVFRTALFKSQGLMLKAICFSSANVADKFSGICWRHVPCSRNFIHGKIRIEILQPTTCSAPSRSLSPTEPQTAGEDFQVRI